MARLGHNSFMAASPAGNDAGSFPERAMLLECKSQKLDPRGGHTGLVYRAKDTGLEDSACGRSGGLGFQTFSSLDRYGGVLTCGQASSDMGPTGCPTQTTNDFRLILPGIRSISQVKPKFL